MTSRQEAVEAVLDPRRVVGAHREEAAFQEFCISHAIPDGPDSVALYLTSLLDTGRVHGRGLRYRLHLLDVAARIAGTGPPSQDPSLRAYLRGLHRTAALASPERGVDPIHREWVHALSQVIMRPTPQQHRDVALLLTAYTTGLPASVLRDLNRNDLRFRRSHAELTLPPYARRGSRHNSVLRLDPQPSCLCPVSALRTWTRERRPVSSDPLFSTTEEPPDVGRTLRPLLRLIRSPGGQPLPVSSTRLLRHVNELLAPKPRAVRDHAIVLMAFVGSLRTNETIRLRQQDVTVARQGLLLKITGRPDPATAIPPGQQPEHCPVEAWLAWRRLLSTQRLAQPSLPAFLQVSDSVVRNAPMAEAGLNLLVQQRCDGAGIAGAYVFTSLRTGFIRSAARTCVPEYLIARQAGLRTLSSVALHIRREVLVSDSVAARVGL